MSTSTIVVTPDVIESQLIRSLESGCRYDTPYRHWLLSDVFHDHVVTSVLALPFAAPVVTVSGTREVNNGTRRYFDPDTRRAFAVAGLVADAFQSRRIVDTIGGVFDVSLARTYLRVEYALDTDGFWLEPHTDIGPKRLSMLVYLSRDPGVHYGTDVYWDRHRHCKTIPYASNSALVFVPSDKTWHGVEKRQIVGVRKSLIVNYVSEDWRSREQLSFPDAPVS